MNYYFQCIECNQTYKPAKNMLYVCPSCSLQQKPMHPLKGGLRVILPYSELRKELDKFSFHPHALLPVEYDFLPNFSVGDTPLVVSDRICKDLDFPELYFKNDGLNPSASLKDRASFLVAAIAKKFGIQKLITASTGNAASSMAAVAAACGMESIVVIPHNTPKAKLVQSFIYGANVIPIKGTYDKAFELTIKYTNKYGGMNRNTAYNPFTTEGKKTVALEIFKQLDNSSPDIVFIPTGDGVILSGVYKGFYDLLQLNWIKKMPRLVSVQAEGSNVINRAIATGRLESATDVQTIADSISVAAPQNGIMTLKDIVSSNGYGVTVTDQEIIKAQQYLGRTAGLFVEPAAASAFAGFTKGKDKISKKEKIVILLTGNGLKDVPGALKYLDLPQAVKPDLDSINLVKRDT